MLEALVVLLLVAGVYFVGRLIWMVVGSIRVVSKATTRSRAELLREVAALPTEEVRARLVRVVYVTDAVRQQASVQQFASRIERHDEVALAAEYPPAKLHRLLVDAERAGGLTGRPEAGDAAGTLSVLLEELVRRTSAHR